MKPLGSIQVLRALAALGVVMFHACQWSGVDFAVGAAGVDLFFLISGFVLWLALEQRPISPGAFLMARWRRTAPLYGLATLATEGLALWRPDWFPVIDPGIGHLVMSLLLIPHLDASGGPFPTLPTGWTLIYEAFFYLALAVSLALPKNRRWPALSGMLLAGALLGFGYHGWYLLLTNPLLLEFLVGAALARLWTRGTYARVPTAWGWGAMVAGLAALTAQQICGLRSDFWRPILWGAPAALVLGGALILQVGAAWGEGRAWRPLRVIGDGSYSLYLCQLPVVMLVAALSQGLPTGARVMLAAGAALAVGMLCRAWVEKPLMLALARSPQPGALLRGVITRLAAKGSAAGLPNRKPWA